MIATAPSPTLLAIDSASPIVSVAVGSASTVLASRAMAIARSSEALLAAIDETLAESGRRLAEIDGLVALRGPGSFTGLRVGLATLLGLHQATNIRAVAVPTLDVLALVAPAQTERVAVAVNALRGEWFVKLFVAGGEATEPKICPAAEITAMDPDCIVTHHVEQLAKELSPEIDLLPAGELAPHALRYASRHTTDWSPATLLDPLYLRAPAIHGKG